MHRALPHFAKRGKVPLRAPRALVTLVLPFLARLDASRDALLGLIGLSLGQADQDQKLYLTYNFAPFVGHAAHFALVRRLARPVFKSAKYRLSQLLLARWTVFAGAARRAKTKGPSSSRRHSADVRDGVKPYCIDCRRSDEEEEDEDGEEDEASRSLCRVLCSLTGFARSARTLRAHRASLRRISTGMLCFSRLIQQ